MKTDIYTMHVPILEEIDNELVYHKIEKNDDFIFRKTFSVSINAMLLSSVSKVKVTIPHRSVVISATKDEILRFNDKRTYKGETKYYYPCAKWYIESGDMNWIEKAKNDI